MKDQRLEQAIYNNALWCDTICCAHGKPGEFLKGMWLNRHETPPFYPNAITLTKHRGTGIQMSYLRKLIEGGIPGEWGIKDSYAALDLTALGFRILFEAEWIWRGATLPGPDGEISGVQWGKVTEAAELDAWERAWGDEPANAMNPNQAHLFLPTLLTDENIAIIAAYQEQRIIAGGIANCTGEVVGVSNVFVPDSEEERFRAGCLAQVSDAFPGLPLVGYEAGRDLAEMRTEGFEDLGPLRIWLKVDKAE